MQSQLSLNLSRVFYPDLGYPYNSQKRRMYDRLKACAKHLSDHRDPAVAARTKRRVISGGVK
jgi:hypothetical protein